MNDNNVEEITNTNSSNNDNRNDDDYSRHEQKK